MAKLRPRWVDYVRNNSETLLKFRSWSMKNQRTIEGDDVIAYR